MKLSLVVRTPAHRKGAMYELLIKTREAILGAGVDHITDELNTLAGIILLDTGKDRACGLAMGTGCVHECDHDGFAAKGTQEQLFAVLHIKNVLRRLARSL